jgi:peptide methionine sulfoxide reductase msrA/msrB
MRRAGIIVLVMALAGCSAERENKMASSGLETATFAGGCFWCMEPAFEQLEGVTDVVAGYTGGDKENPTYEEVSTGGTGHFEAVRVTYDPAEVSYGTLLDVFFSSIDPADPGGQFADRGTQYMTAVFYGDEEQKQAAERAIAALERSGKFDQPIAVKILPAAGFYFAEEYHQDYYKKNPVHYGIYKKGSGRDSYIKRLWGENK